MFSSVDLANKAHNMAQSFFCCLKNKNHSARETCNDCLCKLQYSIISLSILVFLCITNEEQLAEVIKNKFVTTLYVPYYKPFWQTNLYKFVLHYFC